MSCGCNRTPCGCNKISRCGSCNTSPCGCNTAVPSPCGVSLCEQLPCTPSPQIVNVGAFKIASSFNVPTCNASASVFIENLVNVPVGAYFWAAGVGYLQIISADISTGIVVLQNNCNFGNAAPGTTVVACTVFAVVDPPAETPGGGSQTGIFVAIDFTAPAVGDCLLITVTGVEGLAVGKNVGIGSGIYRLQAINDSTHITICNDGAGITPGSSVIAKTGTIFNYPITLIDVNPCTNAAVLRGKVLVCKDDIVQPIEVTEVGQILVAVDEENNEWEARFLGVPTRTCATVLCCLTLVPGTLVYIIAVSDSSQFEVGDILQIGSRTDRFVVDLIIDATHIQATIDTNPASVQTIEEGASICIVDCCEDLQNQINVINNTIAAIPCSPLEMWLANQVDEVVSSTDLVVDSTDRIRINPSGPASISLTNASTCRNAVVSFYLEAKFVGDSAGGEIGLQFTMSITEDGGVPFVETVNHSFDENDVNDAVVVRLLTRTLIPGQNKQIDIASLVSYYPAVGVGGPGAYTVRDWLLRITAVGHT